MQNRLSDYFRSEKKPTASAPPATAATAGWKQALAPVERFIVEHPQVSLAGAFFIGVAIGCLSKRR